MTRLPTLLALVTTIAAVSAAADPAADVRCREIGFSKSVETLQPTRFASFIDPDARFVGGSVARGRETIVNNWHAFFVEDAPLIKWRPQFVEVLGSGDLALTRGPYRINDKDEHGNPREAWGTFNSVWRLTQDGEWLIVFDAGGNPTEEPDAETRALLDAEDDCDSSE